MLEKLWKSIYTFELVRKTSEAIMIKPTEILCRQYCGVPSILATASVEWSV